VQAATTDKMRLQNEAKSYANRVIPEPRGEAERIQLPSVPSPRGGPRLRAYSQNNLPADNIAICAPAPGLHV